MSKKKRHTNEEIAAKLVQADAFATDGKVQSEIARVLGISVMTLHRWRKSMLVRGKATDATRPLIQNMENEEGPLLTELQLENSRLRRIVTDLLLEKLKHRETFLEPHQGGRPSR
jgi:transposase